MQVHVICKVRPKKNNYMFLRHRPHHLQPPASKIFIAFTVFTLKIVYTSLTVSLGRLSFAAILFVDWHTKGRKFFRKLLRYIVF